MRIACLMMQKNERDLIKPWIIYHANLFSLSNLYIYDNGSTDSETLATLKHYEKLGLNIDYTFSTKQDFEQKGKIISSRIHDLEIRNQYDFFFPLDCDEFIACLDQNEQINLDLESIKNTLSTFKEDPRTLAIQRAYDNSPIHIDYYLPREDQRKCFFARGACDDLDIGFHQGKAKTTTEQTKTPIIYFHFHHKPYDEFKNSSLEKLSGRVSNFSREALSAHFQEKKPGFHLIPRLLMSEKEYNKQFSIKNRVYYPQLTKVLQALGVNIQTASISKESEGKGYIDTIKIESSFLKISGWAINEKDQPTPDLAVILDGKELPIWELQRINREDVYKAEPNASLNCGFTIKIPLPTTGALLEIIARESRAGAAKILLLGEAAKADWARLQETHNKS